MARIGVAKTRMLLLRSCKAPEPERRCMSKLAKVDLQADKRKDSIKGDKKNDPSSWVPHPRTGIYFPEGHERVMDDVPEGAASLGQSSWLRNIDGVDKPDPAEAPRD